MVNDHRSKLIKEMKVIVLVSKSWQFPRHPNNVTKLPSMLLLQDNCGNAYGS